MILIFDLDDTLYDELDFVRSGFRAVASWGQEQFGWSAAASYDLLMKYLIEEGRGRIFNRWLGNRGRIREAVNVYRHYLPSLQLWDPARRALDVLADQPLYLVTDGHKGVQAKKIEALGIGPMFCHAYITHRYGRVHAKPSTYCFELIRRRERVEWGNLVYVGDNPQRDFVNLNRLGVRTIRVLTGQHRQEVAKPGFDAKFRIPNMDSLPAVVKKGRSQW